MSQTPFTTVIDCSTFATQRTKPDTVILDCRFDLANPDHGAASYRLGCIPDACYVHLDHDLSGAKAPHLGRHPLPDADAFRTTAAALNITPTTQVFCYDQNSGAFAARCWWLLRWIGHRAVAVIDGGYDAWHAQFETSETGADRSVGSLRSDAQSKASYPVQDSLCKTISADEILQAKPRLVDARAPERFSGAQEPIDPVAGHIPGAVNLPFNGNLQRNGLFKAPTELAQRHKTTDAEAVVHYCGSGVTATHNVLASCHAGLPEPTLYPGSWSEWITEPSRGVETG